MPPNTPPLPSGGVSPTDILTALRNAVQAINALSNNYLAINGKTSKENISATTLVSANPGRVAAVSVTTAGSTTGLIYDSSNASVLTSPLFVVPEAVGVYVVNLPVDSGIVVVPGTSQVLTVSFA